MTIVCGGGSTIAHDFVATHALVSPRPASNGAILTGGGGGGGGGGGAARKFAHAPDLDGTKRSRKGQLTVDFIHEIDARQSILDYPHKRSCSGRKNFR
jgi:hypothetical protein